MAVAAPDYPQQVPGDRIQYNPGGIAYAKPQAPGPGPYDPAQFAGINFTPPTSHGTFTDASPAVSLAPSAPVAPPMPDFMTPAMQQYINQFKQSQAAQQQAINAGLVQSISGLNERRDAASKVAATLPGEFDKAYQAAAANQKFAAAQSGFGHETIGGNADQALITAANTQQQAAGHANQPLLEAGITADYSKGRTTLDNTHMMNQAAIAQQQQAFDGQLLQARAQWQQQQQDKTAAYQHDADMATLQSNLALRNQLANPSKSETPEDQALNQKAIAAGFESWPQLQQAQNDPFYRAAEQAIRTGKRAVIEGSNNVGIHGSRKDIIKQVAGSNQNTLKALRYNGVINDADLQSLYK